MYTESTNFESENPIAYEVIEIQDYALHCHDNAIEILLIINGEAQVNIGFETFYMSKGEYVVIKSLDAHSILADNFDEDRGKAQILCLYFDMDYFKKLIPHLDYVFFACESFDLAKYKNETSLIRNQILSIPISIIGSESHINEKAIEIAEKLIKKMVEDYDLLNYYNRKWNADYKKTEKYYKIASYMHKYYNQKNLLDVISQKEFYSKSYITHLFKEVGANSFQDVLSYFRVFFSIKNLLTTDIPIHQISDDVGFSDIKYYTNTFKKWYLCTPSEYRKSYKSNLKEKRSQIIPIDKKLHGILLTLKNQKSNDSSYRAAINPLTLKAMPGFGIPLNVDVKTFPQLTTNEVSREIFINVEGCDKMEICFKTSEMIKRFESAGHKIVLILPFRGSYSICQRTLNNCVEHLGPISKTVYWIITYNEWSDCIITDKLCTESKSFIENKKIKSVFMI